MTKRLILKEKKTGNHSHDRVIPAESTATAERWGIIFDEHRFSFLFFFFEFLFVCCCFFFWSVIFRVPFLPLVRPWECREFSPFFFVIVVVRFSFALAGAFESITTRITAMFCIFFCRFPVRYRTGSAVRSIMNDLWIVSVSVFFFWWLLTLLLLSLLLCFNSDNYSIESDFALGPFWPIVSPFDRRGGGGGGGGKSSWRAINATSFAYGRRPGWPTLHAICIRWLGGRNLHAIGSFFFFFCALSLSLSLSLHLFAD